MRNDKMTNKKSLLIVFSILFISLPLCSQDRTDKDVAKGLARVTELMEIIGKTYPSEVEPGNMVEGAIRGMLNQLDPHSNYMSAEQTKQLSSQQVGEYSGVGMTIGLREGKMTVVSPMPGGPAAKQGMRTGDIITHIEGIKTSEEDYIANVDMLRGKKGTPITITILREGMEGPFDVTIIRDRISLKTVPFHFMIDKEVGIIRLTSFAQTSDKEVEEAIEDLKLKGMKKLILDLRSNPGGDLDASAGVVNLFVDEGIITYTKGLKDSSRLDFNASPDRTRWGGPLIVLQSNGSASGSEVVAGALQDHDRAWLVGEKSWGKGLVQSRFPLSYDASLSLTTAKYYTPSGRLIQRAYTPGSFDDYFNPPGEESQNLMEKAKTDLGRTVYGGNGITPDTEVNNDEVTSLTQQVLLSGHIFNFATLYIGNNSDISHKFRADETVMREFKQFLKEKKLKVKEAEWKKDYTFLSARITMEILNRIVDEGAGYKAVLRYDKQLQEALKHWGDAQDLLNRKLAAKQ